MEYTIEPMQPADWAKVRAIYAEGLATGIAAFQLKPPLWKTWDAGHLACGRAIARDANTQAILGWAALAPVADT